MYINLKGHTVLVPGDIIRLQEEHQNSCYTFKKGEMCRIVGNSNGENYYSFITLDSPHNFYCGGCILGGLMDNSIEIVFDNGLGNHQIRENLQTECFSGILPSSNADKNKRIAGEIVKLMFMRTENY